MNILFTFNCPFGDTIANSKFFFDYHKIFPQDTIYWRFAINYPNVIHLFDYNPLVHLYNGEKIDKEFNFTVEGNFKVENLISGKCTILNLLYYVFERDTGIHIPEETFTPCIYLDPTKKAVMKRDKPMCIVNATCGYDGYDARFWGTENFQKVIDALYDKIYFLQTGVSGYNGFAVKPLNHLAYNLLNKTNTPTMMQLMYNADLVLTAESGIFHLSHLETYKQRHVFTIAGNKTHPQAVNLYNTPNVYDHWYGFAKHYPCYKSGDRGCQRQCTNNLGHAERTVCDLPVKISNNECIPQCFYDIPAEQIIEDIKQVI